MVVKKNIKAMLKVKNKIKKSQWEKGKKNYLFLYLYNIHTYETLFSQERILIFL